MGQAVSRFGKRLEREPKLRGQLRPVELELSNVMLRC